MSLFSDIVDQVYTVTNRLDLVAETALAVRQATLAAHRSEMFVRDLQELLVGPLTAASVFQLDIATYFPNWRAFAYLRPYTFASASPSGIIIGPNEFIAPDGIFDEYLAEKTNVAYVAGSNINIRLEGNYDSFICGYYQNVVTLPVASYDSWIARDASDIIVIDAAYRVLQSIGWDEAAARLKVLLFGPNGDYHNVVGGLYATLKTSFLIGAGR
jgi:hypothetical protein